MKALEYALKNGLESANRCKIWPVKRRKSEIFSAPGDAQESANGTTINVFYVRFLVKFRMQLINILRIALKSAFKIYIKVHKKVHPRLH